MALQIGIVGLPKVNKSTLFNALTQAGGPRPPALSPRSSQPKAQQRFPICGWKYRHTAIKVPAYAHIRRANMAQFKAFSPNVQVSGAGVLTLVAGMEAFEEMALQILAKHGIIDPKENEWYPCQPYLDAYREIAETIGPYRLKRIGRAAPERALWPPDIDSIEKALASIDAAYHMNNRGDEVGHYHFEKTGERSGKMECYNPYPCSFDIGLIEATATKLAPPGTTVTVRHESDDQQPCRQEGGERCTYHISW
jgi:hypothetical protein